MMFKTLLYLDSIKKFRLVITAMLMLRIGIVIYSDNDYWGLDIDFICFNFDFTFYNK